MSTLLPSKITPASKHDIAPPQTTPTAHLDKVAKALALLRYEDEHIEIDPATEKMPDIIPANHVERILQAILLQQQQNTKPREDNPLHLARLEHFVSQGISLKFDGDQEKLILWIKRFRTLWTNAVWHQATYITHNGKTYDLLTEFIKITESVIKEQAITRWTPENWTKSLSQDNPALFYARILGKVIANSATNEFYTTLQNYSSVDLSNDGPYLLRLILSHFHTSTITYNERVRSAIRTCSLSTDHAGNVQTYLIWLHHQLDILTTNQTGADTSNNDLVKQILSSYCQQTANAYDGP